MKLASWRLFHWWMLFREVRQKVFFCASRLKTSFRALLLQVRLHHLALALNILRKNLLRGIPPDDCPSFFTSWEPSWNAPSREKSAAADRAWSSRFCWAKVFGFSGWRGEEVLLPCPPDKLSPFYPPSAFFADPDDGPGLGSLESRGALPVAKTIKLVVNLDKWLE